MIILNGYLGNKEIEDEVEKKIVKKPPVKFLRPPKGIIKEFEEIEKEKEEIKKAIQEIKPTPLTPSTDLIQKSEPTEELPKMPVSQPEQPQASTTKEVLKAGIQ